MKKIFLFVFILAANWCSAQIYANQKNVNATTYQYIEVWEKFNKGSGKFLVMVDYGQDLSADKGGNMLKMHNNTGGVLEFNSIVSILNYFYMNGWELTATKTTDEVESYLLKRRNGFKLPEIKEEASPSIGSN